MKLINTVVLAAAMQVGMAAVALAQAPQEDDIVVTAPSASDERQVRSYVTELTTPSRTRSPMPRWYRPLCLGVVGMQAAQAQVLNDRIGELADAMGLRVRGPGCRPNVLIHFSRDAGTLARSIADQSNLVSVNNATGNSQGEDALQDFVQAQSAVRWWHVSRTGADGMSFGRDSQQSGEQERTRVQEWSGPGGGMSDEFTPSAQQMQEFDAQDQTSEEVTSGTRVREVSRLRGGVMEMMDYVIIVIDATKTGHTTVGALADYVAMVTLAQINPEAETGAAPTILNLFNEDASLRPSALTSWDLAYLRGLYASADNPRSTRQQEGQIVRWMMRGR